MLSANKRFYQDDKEGMKYRNTFLFPAFETHIKLPLRRTLVLHLSIGGMKKKQEVQNKLS